MSNSQQESPQTTELLLTVAEGQMTDTRLDVYITSFVQNATRNKVQQAIKQGYVKVNGGLEKSSYLVQPLDQIHITLPKPPPGEARPEEMPLNIVFEDEHLMVINKPAGLVVHPAFGNWQGTLVNGLLHHTGSSLAGAEDTPTRPGIVHRLDKDTSGLLVVAKTEQALSFLSSKFQKKDVERTYWALVWGHTPEEGTIEGDIARSKKDRKLMTIVRSGEGKPAVTHFRRLELLDELSLLEVRLETGRTHQIRVHLSHRGHFVFGDPVYGGSTVRYGSNTGSRKNFFRNLFEVMPRQCLHAKTLGFVHPATGEMIQFDSELPGDFAEVLKRLRALSSE